MNNIQNYTDTEITNEIIYLKSLVVDNHEEELITYFYGLLQEIENTSQCILITTEVKDTISNPHTKGHFIATLAFYIENQVPSIAKNYFNMALDILEKMDKIDHVLSGNIYLSMQEYSKAITHFSNLDMTISDNLKLIADTCFSASKYNEAINYYIKYLEIEANKMYHDKINGNIGLSYLFLEKFELGEEFLVKANILNDTDLLIEVATYFDSINMHEHALKYFLVLRNNGSHELAPKIDALHKKIGTTD